MCALKIIIALVCILTAKSAGIPLLEAYLNASSSKTHGVNFAVAGSTALPVEFLAEKGVIAPVTNSSLTKQLNWMHTHFNTTCHSSKGHYILLMHHTL